MERTPRAILFLFLLLLVDPGVAQNTTTGKADEFHVGVILNLGSLVGKVARTSISLAVKDFYAVHQIYSTKLVLHFRDSMASDVKACWLPAGPPGAGWGDGLLQPSRRRVGEPRHAEEPLRWQAEDGDGRPRDSKIGKEQGV